MIVMRTKCDNPQCKSTGLPENEKKPYIPPYGWLSLKGHFVGCGPAVAVEVCSVECLTAAVEHSLEEVNRR